MAANEEYLKLEAAIQKDLNIVIPLLDDDAYYRIIKISAYHGAQNVLNFALAHYGYSCVYLNEALGCAIAGGHLHIVKFLCKGFITRNCKVIPIIDEKNKYSVDLAKYKGYHKVIEYLREQKLIE